MKNKLEEKWLNNSQPFIQRLTFESNFENPVCVNGFNETIRKSVLEELLNKDNQPVFIEDFINSDGEDEVIAQVDRYGFPSNTVINNKTGIVRVSPYYSDQWLIKFYKKFYRPLYTNDAQFSRVDVFQDQINRGNYYFNFLKDFITTSHSILEIGCGMGGILFPFKMRDFDVKGIDYGEEFVKRGRDIGLNLTNENLEELIEKSEKYDLIILSHLLEHIVDLDLFLNGIKKVLRPGGKLFISVPGIKNIHNAYKSDLLLYLQNAHVWYFSQNTLKALLVTNGFKILKSDEEINCLVTLDLPSNENDRIRSVKNILENEYKFTKKYLLETEENFQINQQKIKTSQIKDKSLIDKTIREFKIVQFLIRIKYKIKLILKF